jgi:hypothetical protein
MTNSSANHLHLTAPRVRQGASSNHQELKPLRRPAHYRFIVSRTSGSLRKWNAFFLEENKVGSVQDQDAVLDRRVHQIAHQSPSILKGTTLRLLYRHACEPLH